MPNLGPDFYPKLVEIASELQMKPEDILAIMASESGINPTIPNQAGAAAIGLIQFTPGTLKGLGFHDDWKEFGKISAEEQLDYVKKYIQSQERLNGGPFKSAAHFYVATFWPAALKLPGIRKGNPNTIIVEENPRAVRVGRELFSKKYYNIGIKINPKQESRAYKENRLFHGSTPGAITLRDMQAQVDRVRSGQIYNNALFTMRNTTGYKPESNAYVPQQYLAQTKTHRQQIPTKMRGQQMPSNINTTIDQILEESLRSAMASIDKSNKNLYNKLLPNHNILIKVNSDDYNNSIEFSRILSTALSEELSAKANIYSDGNNVEIECQIAGPSINCLDAVEELSNSIADTFKEATAKIGGIEIKTKCFINKKSSYEYISSKQADINYRTFLLKFI